MIDEEGEQTGRVGKWEKGVVWWGKDRKESDAWGKIERSLAPGEWEEGDLRLEVGGKDSSARARVLLERPSYQAILQLYASQRTFRCC